MNVRSKKYFPLTMWWSRSGTKWHREKKKKMHAPQTWKRKHCTTWLQLRFPPVFVMNDLGPGTCGRVTARRCRTSQSGLRAETVPAFRAGGGGKGNTFTTSQSDVHRTAAAGGLQTQEFEESSEKLGEFLPHPPPLSLSRPAQQSRRRLHRQVALLQRPWLY